MSVVVYYAFDADNCTKYLTRLTPRTRVQDGVVILSGIWEFSKGRQQKGTFCFSVNLLLSKYLAEVIMFPSFILWHVSPRYAADSVEGCHFLDEPIWFPPLPNVRGVLFEVCFSLRLPSPDVWTDIRILQDLLACFWGICSYWFNSMLSIILNEGNYGNKLWYIP